jgi:hypothetical protein
VPTRAAVSSLTFSSGRRDRSTPVHGELLIQVTDNPAAKMTAQEIAERVQRAQAKAVG